MEKKNTYNLWIFILVTVGLLQGSLYAYTTVMTPDQSQLLIKGIKLAHQGVWTHFGNLVTGGGNVPGSLTSALIGWPLMLWDNVWSPEILVAILQLFSLLLLNHTLKDFFSPKQRFIFIALFWLSPWRASKMILWNPSYLFFATALHLWTASELFKRRSFWMTFLHIFAIGFAFQLHTSSAILGLVSLYLFARKSLRVNWWGFSLGMALVGLSLVPFVLESQANQQIMPVVENNKEHFFYGRGFVYFFPMIKGILYWPRFTSMIFPSYIFKHIEFSWVQNPVLKSSLDIGIPIIQYVFGVASFVISIWAFGWLIKAIYGYRKTKFLVKSFLDNYILATLLATVIISGLSPISFSHWHLFLILPIAYISFTQFITQKWGDKSWAPQLFIAVLVYFVFYNFLAATSSDYYSFHQNVHTEYPSLKQSLGIY